jgi:hypothetical protein
VVEAMRSRKSVGQHKVRVNFSFCCRASALSTSSLLIKGALLRNRDRSSAEKMERNERRLSKKALTASTAGSIIVLWSNKYVQ